MTFVFLWTDYCVYLLLLMALALFWKIMRSKYARHIWRSIMYRPLNIATAIILCVYAMVGLLDSIHFYDRKSVDQITPSGMISLLDKILSPIASHKERSFSAPMAIYGFTKENVTLPNGEITRVYPRLKYAGVHLENESQKWPDIRHRLLISSVETLILGTTLAVLFILLGCLKHHLSWEIFFSALMKGQTYFPWRTFLGTLYILLFIVIFIHDFMPYYHILGTTQIGEDVLYQSLKSIRTGLIIGTLTTLVMLPFAVLFGVMAGYFRGWIDDVIQYIYTTLSSIPGVLLIAAAVLAMQMVMDRHSEWFQTMSQRADARLLILCAILGITSWTSLCRFMRGEALKLSQVDFVQAAHSLGVSHFKIIMKHILPNVFHIILITVALDFSGLVLAEAVLSYVGVGVDPSTYSWGMMINGSRLEMARIPMVWWNLAAAFIFMFILVLAANIFSDAVRDAFDPYQKGGVK